MHSQPLHFLAMNRVLNTARLDTVVKRKTKSYQN